MSARPRRCGILPARFRDDVSDDDGILCDLCQLKEPPGMADNTVFWVDCDSCGNGCTTTVLSRKMPSLKDSNVTSVHLGCVFFLAIFSL